MSRDPDAPGEDEPDRTADEGLDPPIPPEQRPPPEDDLDEFLTPTRRFVRASLPIVGILVVVAMVLVLGQGLIDAWLFDRAGDRVEEQLDPEDRALARSVVLVRTVGCDGTSGSGTAFVTEIDGQRLFLTNRHVVEGARTVGLRSLLGESVPTVTAWRLADGADVASLIVAEPDALGSTLPLDGADVPGVGTPVRTVGFPSALPFTTTGEIVNTTGSRVTARIRTEPGASGSPLLDDRGEVVAQIFARTDDGLGVATSAGALRRAVDALGEPISSC